MKEAFEAWLSANGYGNHSDTLHMVRKDNLYKLWQAATAAERERCGKIVEQHNDGDEFETVTKLIAAAIRAGEAG